MFEKVATRIAIWVGKPTTFGIALLILCVWAGCGPFLGYSETWQLLVNTGTTIITFLMVFVIQNSQNRESKAVQLKLDEILCSIEAADNERMQVEDLSETELDTLKNKDRERAHKI